MQSIIELENYIEKMVLETANTPHRLASVVHCAIATVCTYDTWEGYYMYCQH